MHKNYGQVSAFFFDDLDRPIPENLACDYFTNITHKLGSQGTGQTANAHFFRSLFLF